MSETAEPGPPSTPNFWRAFLIYTGSRIGLFVLLLGLLYGIGVRGLIVYLVALVLSGGLSYFLLERQRSTFGVALQQRVERRRVRAAGRVGREDAVADQLIAEEEGRRNARYGGVRGP
ncbi:MAG: DUF4229 domain-containing protein [Actinomycetes bacterium]